MDYVSRVAPKGKSPTTEAHVAVISQMTSCRHGRPVKEFIEPRTGWARHPRAEVCYPLFKASSNSAEFNDTSHLLLANRCAREPNSAGKSGSGKGSGGTSSGKNGGGSKGGSGGKGSGGSSTGGGFWSRVVVVAGMMRPQHSPPSSSIARRLASGGGGGATSRNLLFDAGSSGPADAHVGATRNLAQGFSVPQFAELYQARSCVQFDAIYAWELRPMNRTKWYDALAPSLRKKVDFRNVGVAPEPAEGVRNASSVLQTLRAEARPADFVVLKLDIDNAQVARRGPCSSRQSDARLGVAGLGVTG